MPTLPAARYTQQLDSIFTTTNHSLHLDNSRGQQLAALVNQVTLVTVIGHVRHAYRHQMYVSVSVWAGEMLYLGRDEWQCYVCQDGASIGASIQCVGGACGGLTGGGAADTGGREHTPVIILQSPVSWYQPSSTPT